MSHSVEITLSQEALSEPAWVGFHFAHSIHCADAYKSTGHAQFSGDFS